ncbi:hypothetical protein FHG87_000035 [Trinorchestia longiramus]|nr:hypothetical protein FHG87_000035 [Trinorchestia longiramus]
MSYTIIIFFSLVIAAHTLFAHPLELDENTVLVDNFETKSVDSPYESDAPSTIAVDVPIEFSDEKYDAVLSRTRRGLRSRLKRLWKKHVRPLVKRVAKTYVVQRILPRIQAWG